jgi:hypothetical protein
MGAALELIAGQATAPSTTFTAWTVATGNSLTIRSADVNSQVSLLAAWGFNNAAGAMRIRSPRLHDNVDGIRMRLDATDSRPVYPRWGFMQKLIPQDTLIAEQTGSGTSGKIEQGAFLVYYQNLPGIAARFITPDQLRQFGVNMMGQDVPITAGSSGGYSGQAAVNSSRDNWKANTLYALVGYRVDAACCSVRIQGADVGNLGLGGPGAVTSPHETATWFEWLSAYYGIPLIPVFQSANKGNILVDVQQNDGGAAVGITFFFVELMPTITTT